MRRVILLGILLGLVYYVYISGMPLFMIPRTGGNSGLSARIAASTVTTGYLLEEDRWLRFAVEPEISLFKVLSHAGLPVSEFWVNERDYPYEIQYQILDREGRVMADHRYWHDGSLTLYRDPETGKRTVPRFYLNENILPADGKVMLINFKNHPESGKQAAFIRFRLNRKDPVIRDVLLRVYTEEKISERKVGYLWHRLNRGKKAYLARGNLYPPELLNEREKFHLLHHIWQPLGPAGIEKMDYFTRNLYVLQEVEGDPVQETPVIPEGLFVSPPRRGMIPLPEGGGILRLAVQKVAGANAGTHEGPVRLLLRHFGVGSSERPEIEVSFAGEKTEIEQFFNGGLIEVESSGSVTVRAFLIRDGIPEEITPRPALIRTYLARNRMPVTFPIIHTERSPTPFRADFRVILEGGDIPSSPQEVRYQLFDMTSALLREGTVPVPPVISFYDRLIGEDSETLISDPVTRYFQLTPEVAFIRFTSASPVLISAYDRLHEMIKETRVPRDFYKYHLEDPDRQPSWFSFRPSGYERLVMENRAVLVSVQYRPPEDRPELVSGQYRWESFPPEKAWKGRWLLLPKTPEENLRREQYASVFRSLPRGRETVLNFRQTEGKRKTVRPVLLFLNQNGKPAEVRFFLDGSLFFQTAVTGTRGELELPPFPVGRHRVRLSSPPGIRWYISHAGEGDRPRMKRFARKIGRSGLEFRYEKKNSEKEVLMVHFYTPTRQKEDTVLKASVLNPAGGASPRAPDAPLEDWSFLTRRFVIRPDHANPAGYAPVLHTRNAFTDSGRLFFLPLGSDLPPGTYPVRFDMEAGEGGYLIFSKITRGIFEKRAIFREKRLQESRKDGKPEEKTVERKEG